MHRIKAELSHAYKVILNPTLESESNTHRADFQITPTKETSTEVQVVSDLKIVEADSKTALAMYKRAKVASAEAQTEKLMEEKAKRTIQEYTDRGMSGAGGTMGQNNTGGVSWQICKLAR